MILAFVGWIAAFLMTVWGAVLVSATIADDPGGAMIDATGWAAASTLVLVAAWRWLDRVGRILTVVLLVVNVFVVIEATSRW